MTERVVARHDFVDLDVVKGQEYDLAGFVWRDYFLAAVIVDRFGSFVAVPAWVVADPDRSRALEEVPA